MSQNDLSLHPLLENALHGVKDRLLFFTDKVGQILFCNLVAQEHLGFDFDGGDREVNVLEFHADIELQLQALELEKELNRPVQPTFEVIALQATLQSSQKNWMYRCRRGKVFPVELLVTVAHDEQGEIGGYLLVARDITEQFTRKEALRDSEERYRSVVNVMEEGIILQDGDGTVTACNASAERMMGLTLEQMNDPFAGVLAWDAIGEDGFPFPASEYPMTVSLRTGQPCSRVVMGLRRANGVLTWLSINSRPLFRPDATEPHAVMISLSDITERRRIENELARAHDVAVNAAQLKSAFLANASHEIRTPLNGVIGIVDILLDTDLSERQRTYVKTLDRSAESLLALINDLLDLSKIEAGKNIIEHDTVDIFDVVRSAMEQLAPQAQAKGIKLDLFVAPDISHQLCGDGKRLRQVLSNLLFNALKFTNAGEISVRVLQHEETEYASTLCFEVTDTGIGIIREAREHVFEPFWQDSEHVQSQYASTGLGLAISKQLVELMGGRIWVESIVGRGSTFSFTIPMRKPEAQIIPSFRNLIPWNPSIEVVEEAEKPAKDRQFVGVRVLLVEDNEVNQQIVLYKLQEWGCRTDVAGDGIEALACIEKNTYDVVLMDCQLPRMDGYQTTEEIRRREAKEQGNQTPLYIIALTANAMQGDREKCLAVGMNDYLSKPVRFPTLNATFERWKVRSESKSNSPSSVTTEPKVDGQVTTFNGNPFQDFDISPSSKLQKELNVDETIIDATALDNLRSSPSGDSLLLELIDLFLKDSTKYFAAIHNALDEDNVKSAALQAHALGGSCSHFGAIQLRESCLQIEEYGRANDLLSAKNELSMFDKRFFAAQNQLKDVKISLAL